MKYKYYFEGRQVPPAYLFESLDNDVTDNDIKQTLTVRGDYYYQDSKEFTQIEEQKINKNNLKLYENGLKTALPH